MPAALELLLDDAQPASRGFEGKPLACRNGQPRGDEAPTPTSSRSASPRDAIEIALTRQVGVKLEWEDQRELLDLLP